MHAFWKHEASRCKYSERVMQDDKKEWEPEGRRERSREQGRRGRDLARWRPPEREGFLRTRVLLVFFQYSSTECVFLLHCQFPCLSFRIPWNHVYILAHASSGFSEGYNALSKVKVSYIYLIAHWIFTWSHQSFSCSLYEILHNLNFSIQKDGSFWQVLLCICTALVSY